MISVTQFCATSHIPTNLAICSRLIAQSAQNGAKMVFLPEASDYISSSLTEQDTKEFVNVIAQQAQQHSIYVSIGVHESTTLDPKRKFNSHLIINQKGKVIANYHKIHLFDINIPNGPQLQESKYTIPGHEICHPIPTPCGKLGLLTCYDLRFPQHSMHLRDKGAQILSYPSAFTVPTGEAHWKVLLRARAIETQSYVVASAQVGKHHEKRSSYGHACIVDPWGKIIAECVNDEEDFAIAEIDLSFIDKLRSEMPLEMHARRDLY